MNLARILNVVTAIGLALCEIARAGTETAAVSPDGRFQRLGQVESAALTELSGLAGSRRQPGLFWGINDSGNAATLVAVNERLEVAGVLPVEGAYNHDWEDLAGFEFDGQPWLLIADTGDNLGLRAEVSLILVPEPAPTDPGVRPARVIRFQYEDGPRDCEAVAVDGPGRRVLLADKGRRPVGLYELPLDGDSGLRVARRIAEFPELVPTAKPRVSTLGGVQGRGTPTAMSLSTDGRRLVVLSYLSLSLFERTEAQDWPAVLARAVRSQRLPRVAGFEAVGLAPDGRSALLGTEGKRALIYRWTPAP